MKSWGVISRSVLICETTRGGYIRLINLQFLTNAFYYLKSLQCLLYIYIANQRIRKPTTSCLLRIQRSFNTVNKLNPICLLCLNFFNVMIDQEIEKKKSKLKCQHHRITFLCQVCGSFPSLPPKPSFKIQLWQQEGKILDSMPIHHASCSISKGTL